MPEGALSVIFRAKLCAALKKAGLLNQVPRPVWQKDWVVHCKAAGQGRQVLNYLARYIFRVAISNSRLLLSAATTTIAAVDSTPHSPLPEPATPPATTRCPHCHIGQLFEIRLLLPQPKVPP